MRNTVAATRKPVAPRPYRLTVGEYHRMIERAVFPEDARIELIEGQLYEMPPMEEPHWLAVRFVVQAFAALAVQGRLIVQMPITLPAHSEPEPDLAILRPGPWFHKATGEEVVLAVEVADSTRRFDLQKKAPLYQRSGVRETWVIDIRGQRVVVFPREGGTLVYSGGQNTVLTPLGTDEVTLDIDALFAAIGMA